MPKIVSARQLGLTFQNVFGPLGPEKHLTVHHSAGPRPATRQQAYNLVRAYHRQHKQQGWGGLGYAYVIAPDGTLICGRPTSLKGAHVGGWNTANVGVMLPGTTGDRPTRAQQTTFNWLLRYAHTRRMPKAHRTDRPLRKPYTERKGHNQWPGHKSNACPGTLGKQILKEAK